MGMATKGSHDGSSTYLLILSPPPLEQASTDAANRFPQVELAWELACRGDEPQRLCLFRP